jgi:hypothetical protein
MPDRGERQYLLVISIQSQYLPRLVAGGGLPTSAAARLGMMPLAALPFPPPAPPFFRAIRGSLFLGISRSAQPSPQAPGLPRRIPRGDGEKGEGFCGGRRSWDLLEEAEKSDWSGRAVGALHL